MIAQLSSVPAPRGAALRSHELSLPCVTAGVRGGLIHRIAKRRLKSPHQKVVEEIQKRMGEEVRRQVGKAYTK